MNTSQSSSDPAREQRPRNQKRHKTPLRLDMGTLIGGGIFLFFVGIVAWAFYLGRLTPERIWIVSIVSALAAGVIGGHITGALAVQYRALGVGISATGGFALILLIPYVIPAPTGNQPVYVSLVRADQGSVAGRFRISYRRAGAGIGTEAGIDGRATISDLPRGTETLDVTEFVQAGLVLDANIPAEGYVQLPIDEQGYVMVPVRSIYTSPREPKKTEILEKVQQTEFSMEEILAEAATEEEIADAIFTIHNRTGQDFQLWFYDCSFAYREGDAPNFPYSNWMNLDVRDVDTKAQFTHFEDMASRSGVFGLYIEYQTDAKRERQFLGIYNLFEPMDREAIIRGIRPFEIEFTH